MAKKLWRPRATKSSGFSPTSPPSRKSSLGDKLQWIAAADPEALRVLEGLADHLIERLQRNGRRDDRKDE
jgi:hypothetical protein